MPSEPVVKICRSLTTGVVVIWMAVAVFAIPALSLDYPQSLEQELKTLLDASAQTSSDPSTLMKLAGLYLDMGNDLFTEKAKRLATYEEGVRMAGRALDLKEDSAEAHFLYAANMGEMADLKGVGESLMKIDEIKSHVARALQLQKDHVPSLHMGGMLLEALPRFMGGNPDAALRYIQRAVTADPTYTQARLDLAKMYLKRDNPELARSELLAIVRMDHPRDPYAWAKQHRPEAARLLQELEHPK